MLWQAANALPGSCGLNFDETQLHYVLFCYAIRDRRFGKLQTKKLIICMTEQTIPAYDDDEISLLDILVTLAESWKLLVFGPLIMGMLALVLSFWWPSTYESIAIARLTEEEASLFHAAPILDPLVEKFGYLERADGIREDARNALKKDLAYIADKKTKLVTVVAKGPTPERAQAMGRSAFEALFAELVPKGKEKEAILQEIAINNQLILDGVIYLDRVGSKQGNTNNTNNMNNMNNMNNTNNTKNQVANLKLNNLELQLKLETKGREVFAQEPSMPYRKSAPKYGLASIVAMAITGLLLLIWVFVRKAWIAASCNATMSQKIALIKKSLQF